MNIRSVLASSRSWIAALVIASSALSGCATVSEETTAYADFFTDRMEGA